MKKNTEGRAYWAGFTVGFALGAWLVFLVDIVFW